MYVQAGGFFKGAGLNVQIITLSNSGAIAAALAGGAIDVGLANAMPVPHSTRSFPAPPIKWLWRGLTLP